MKKVIIFLLALTCVINVSAQSSSNANGHQYVDLGLPSGLLWATYNVSSDSPADSGDHFVWGGDWRIPTVAEFQELRNHCIWTWTDIESQSGYLVTSAKNGNSIFLPAIENSVYSTLTISGEDRYCLKIFNKGHLISRVRNNKLLIRPVMGAVDNSYDVPQMSMTGSISGVYNSHAYVDLGLPSGIRWAACNIENDNDSAPYFSWGEIETKSNYSEDTYKCNDVSLPEISGNMNHDPARAKWGGTWRLPTKEDFEELLNYCVWTFIKNDDQYGYLVTSIENGNSIFLPGYGYSDANAIKPEQMRHVGSGRYWCSNAYSSSEVFAESMQNLRTKLDYSDGKLDGRIPDEAELLLIVVRSKYEDRSAEDAAYSYSLVINKNILSFYACKKYVGCTIRPVYNPK